MKGKGIIIAVSIVFGILLSCVLLPLGALGLLLLAFSGDDTTGGALPGRVWQEQIVAGSGISRVLVLDVNGIIGAPEEGLLAGGLSQRDVLSQIQQARDDENLQAVVVRVESPGGGVVASSELHDALQELRDSGKTLVVSMGATAASGGYYIATPADRIYANPDTITGSLGVIISLINYEEALDKIGVQQPVIKSGEFKDIGSPVDELSDEERAILQEIVDQAYAGFVDVIVEGRELPREEVLSIADGRIYTGLQAQELGLVDELGNLDAAIDGARELADLPDNARVVRYSSALGLLELLSGSLEQSQQPADPLGLRQLVEPPNLRLEYRMVP